MVGIIRRACNMACNEVENNLGGNASLEGWHILRIEGEHTIILSINVHVDFLLNPIEVGATIDLNLDTIDLQ